MCLMVTNKINTNLIHKDKTHIKCQLTIDETTYRIYTIDYDMNIYLCVPKIRQMTSQIVIPNVSRDQQS